MNREGSNFPKRRKKPYGKKWFRKQPQAVVHALCTKNNTHVTLTDFKGSTLAKKTSGTMKATVIGGLRVSEEVGRQAIERSIKAVELRLKGFGRARSSIHKGLKKAGLSIRRFKQKNSTPHNGCRPKKKRRL
jgi:small subunit ribosomal protein S11